METTSVDSSHDVRYDENSNHHEQNTPMLFNGIPVSSRGRRTSREHQITNGQARMTFNVGGVVFQTLRNTVRNASNQKFKLASQEFLSEYYDAAHDEYFFDRDPEVFRSVLNYWRTGCLHLPSTMCGPQMKEELQFWGLKEIDIESCCWNHYHTWMQTIKQLNRLERDRNPSYLHDPDLEEAKPTTKCGRFKLLMWNLLTDPSYSKFAKIYAYVSLFFVIMAIFSFCASTHKAFQVRIDNDDSNSSSSSTKDFPSGDVTYSSLTPNGTEIVTQAVTTTTAKEKADRQPVQLAPGRDPRIHPALFYIDVICLAFFTAEYVSRFLCAQKRFQFLRSITAIIDLLAILPDYIEFLVYFIEPNMKTPNTFMDFMPFLRLMRAFRIFRLIRRVPGLWIMMYTLKASFKELSLMLVVLLVGTLLFASLIFFVDDNQVFLSIPHGFWWAIVTMTTVGYGDMTPRTAVGQIVGSVTAICGVLMIGFTIPSLVKNFITYYDHVKFVVKKEKLLAEEEELLKAEDSEERRKCRKYRYNLEQRRQSQYSDSWLNGSHHDVPLNTLPLNSLRRADREHNII